MNAPVTEPLRKALEAIALDDRYTQTSGRAFMSGIHALVRLPMLQQMRDAKQGFHTAGFISGYRGSPLGTYDQALWDAARHLTAHDIVFNPGLNEELAVDAVWGSQQLEFDPENKKFDGVFGIWYGKGPGVDRSGDALKHANLSGTAPRGGVIAVAGDDHLSKSSTLAHQSDHTFMACGLPVITPASVQDILDLGLHAFAMSRYSGLWAGMKTVQEVVESAAAVDVDPDRVRIVLPTDFELPAEGVHIRWPDDPLVQEARLMEVKWPAALAYVRANRLNHNVIESPDDRIGIIASGKGFGDVRQALQDLGLDDARCRRLGVRLHKVNVSWPLEPQSLRGFARGLQEVLVVEEKRPIIEQQVKDELYHCPPERRPRVLGKYDLDPEGETGGEWSHARPQQDWLLRATADLTPALVAKAIARLLKRFALPDDVRALIDARLAVIAAQERAIVQPGAQGMDRLPWFCPGCPHNTSTQVPEGSKSMAGIGCHGMVVWMDRSTNMWTQMGGEGTPWIGQAPFSKRTHMFSNVGDGTYNHSGILAIRQSIAAGVNITYKILFNSAVAMTGGQPIDGGGLSVGAMTRELEAEGAKRIVVVTDEPQNFDASSNLAPGVAIRHRDALVEVQKELREVQGVTAIVYVQMCATKKRRERKRGTRAEVDTRVVINELVCEGCGDCSQQSNCVAVQPLETEFGRKRTINQSTCNKDFSCVKGFCPSFVTVEGGQLKKPATTATQPAVSSVAPDPVLPSLQGSWGIVVAGIGGTGVVTIGQVLGMAAHLEGKGVVTQDATGMAQMGGATWSHVQISPSPGSIHASRVAMANADLVIGCDAVVTGNRTTLAAIDPKRTFVVLNTFETPTAAFVGNPDWQSPNKRSEDTLVAMIGDEKLGRFDAQTLATRLMGQTVYANMMMLGYAWQAGRVPLAHASIMRAIELNGVQIEQNKKAFELGRCCRYDLASVEAQARPGQVIRFAKRKTLDEVIAERARFLVDYQDAAYANAYREFVEKVRKAESSVSSTSQLADTVARNLFKLMAYKDEYEVARLHTGTAFRQQLADTFEGDYKLVHHMAPPMFARKGADGLPVKRAYGPWMRGAMHVLVRMKGLRGTTFDPFAYAAERKTERALIGQYQACIEELLATLAAAKLPLAREIAAIPQEIRGFGHVKERQLAKARTKWHALIARWRDDEPARSDLRRVG
jgi:indolepyruvate ferredoxin oxidoreductase